MFGTSTPADAPEYESVKPGAVALVTVTVPAKPAMPLIAVVRFAAVYGRPVPPISTESLPPMRTLNGE